MKENFDKAFEFVLKWEGGYVNNPKDPGGETKYGISKRSYPNLDIKNLTKEQAKSIYYADYWLKAKCNDYAYPRDIIIFDTAVNTGVGTALNLNKEYPDSWKRLLIGRIKYYTNLCLKNPRLGIFYAGWLNRVKDLYLYVKKDNSNVIEDYMILLLTYLKDYKINQKIITWYEKEFS